VTIPFYKYHGTGNDFILVDNITNHNAVFPHNPELIKSLCHRKFGIGADGFIFLEKHTPYDFEMVYYNSDASQSLCGNGSRCAIHLASYLGIINDTANFLAIDGPHQARIQDNLIYLQLHDVSTIQMVEEDNYFLNTGSPHYVRLVKNLEETDVIDLGKAINASQSFQNTGTNVNFVQLEANNQILVRTYERGVNDETLSCGTGVVAAALVASQREYTSPLCIITKGGKLQVSFCKDDTGFSNICLIGPAAQVFQGAITI
jgi:diaminopimelate epimerase